MTIDTNWKAEYTLELICRMSPEKDQLKLPEIHKGKTHAELLGKEFEHTYMDRIKSLRRLMPYHRSKPKSVSLKRMSTSWKYMFDGTTENVTFVHESTSPRYIANLSEGESIYSVEIPAKIFRRMHKFKGFFLQSFLEITEDIPNFDVIKGHHDESENARNSFVHKVLQPDGRLYVQPTQSTSLYLPYNRKIINDILCEGNADKLPPIQLKTHLSKDHPIILRSKDHETAYIFTQ
ncbi:MAG: hypothetical protein ACOCUT_00970 [bacterium]